MNTYMTDNLHCSQTFRLIPLLLSIIETLGHINLRWHLQSKLLNPSQYQILPLPLVIPVHPSPLLGPQRMVSALCPFVINIVHL